MISLLSAVYRAIRLFWCAVKRGWGAVSSSYMSKFNANSETHIEENELAPLIRRRFSIESEEMANTDVRNEERANTDDQDDKNHSDRFYDNGKDAGVDEDTLDS